MTTLLVPSESDWAKVLGPWLKTLLPGDIVLLKSPMASGKTTFVRSALEFWGISEGASPTYALHHRYEKSPLKIDHWDLYRLKDLDELETTAFWDLISETDTISFIEWPDLVPPNQWPESRRKFQFEISKERSGRKVQITVF